MDIANFKNHYRNMVVEIDGAHEAFDTMLNKLVSLCQGEIEDIADVSYEKDFSHPRELCKMRFLLIFTFKKYADVVKIPATICYDNDNDNMIIIIDNRVYSVVNPFTNKLSKDINEAITEYLKSVFLR